MPENDQLTRLGIFLAVGYLCAGIIVSIFISLNLWVDFLQSELSILATTTIVGIIVAAVLGMAAIRFLVPRYGVKAIFEQDLLIVMIGLLFLALALNQAMGVVGLIITVGGATVYFYENFTTQVKAAADGHPFQLCGWALGPIVAVAAYFIFSNYGLLTIRVLFAHYIVIAFWVWVQRLALHTDYSDAPKSMQRLYREFQAATHHNLPQNAEAMNKAPSPAAAAQAHANQQSTSQDTAPATNAAAATTSEKTAAPASAANTSTTSAPSGTSSASDSGNSPRL